MVTVVYTVEVEEVAVHLTLVVLAELQVLEQLQMDLVELLAVLVMLELDILLVV